MNRTLLLTACLLIPFSAPALPAAEQQTEPAQVWTCSMHPNIKLAEPGLCPICNMELVPTMPPRIHVPPQKLEEFCKDYVAEQMAGIEERYELQLFPVVEAYVALHGEDAIPRLRQFLASPNLECVAEAAWRLGKMNDGESIPALKALLTEPRLRAQEVTFTCSMHPSHRSKRPGQCPNCHLELVPAVDSVMLRGIARGSVAGALYLLEDPQGWEALVELNRDGYFKYFAWALAERDTPEARKLLAEATNSDRTDIRLIAIQAQLALGVDENLPEVIRLADNRTSPNRILALDALTRSNNPKAQAALKRIASDAQRSYAVRLVAAAGLVRQGHKEYLQMLRDGIQQEPTVCLQALGDFGDEQDLPRIRRAIEAGPEYVRPFAVTAALKIMRRHDAAQSAPATRPAR